MSLTEEETNFIRFGFLNMMVASKAVRKYFDSKYPPSVLAGELKVNEVRLKGLSFITRHQKKILYPGSGNIVKSEQFDMSLMICILRNMWPCKLPHDPATNWNSIPLPTNTSICADLARTKYYRNFVSHHNNSKLSGTDFSQYWGDLEQAIGRLGGQAVLAEAQSTKIVVMDTSLRDLFLKLRNYETSQKKQNEKINNCQAEIDALWHKIHHLNDSNQQVKAETQKHALTLSDYKDTVETCKKDIRKNEEIIKKSQDQSLTEKNEKEILFANICKLKIKDELHDKMLKELKECLTMHEEKLSKHDGQMTQYGEQLENCVRSGGMKQRQHDTDTSGLVTDHSKVNRDLVKKRGTVPFTSLTSEILNNSLPGLVTDPSKVNRDLVKKRGTVPFTSLTLEILNNLPGQIIQNHQSTTGVCATGLQYPKYDERDVRLHTFQMRQFNCPAARDLANAGFFAYKNTYNEDSVCCFCCGVVLINWAQDDDPWVEHAWWFPQCRFLKESKGEGFIQLVQRQQDADRCLQRNQTIMIENNEDKTREEKAKMKTEIETKFGETDVVLAFKQFIEQKERRPFLMEFNEFLNSLEDMLTEKKSFDELINENKELRQKNRVIRGENRDLKDVISNVRDQIRIGNNEKRAIEDEIRILRDEKRTVNNDKRAFESENKTLRDQNRIVNNEKRAFEDETRTMRDKKFSSSKRTKWASATNSMSSIIIIIFLYVISNMVLY